MQSALPAGNCDSKSTNKMSNGLSCRVCSNFKKRIPEKEVVIELPEDFLEDIVGKNKNKKSRQTKDFYQRMNALLNNGTGVAILHTKSPHMFGKFNEVVDNRLSELISDDSCYSENFEASFPDDSHVIIRVKPVETRQWSVFSFNTKLSVNKGLADPTHGQFRRLLDKYSNGGVSADQGSRKPRQRRKLDTSCLEAQFKDNISGNTVHFHEVVGSEAKSLVDLTDSKEPSRENNANEVFSCIWNKLRLPQYLAAFSKLPMGGSIFYGIKQDKEKITSQIWRQLPQTDALSVFVLNDKSYKVWENVPEESVYIVGQKLIFKDETHREEDKGTFSYEDILSLSENEQNLLSDKIRRAAKDRLLWYPEFPEQNPVHVEFHPITHFPGYCVVEVAIDHFPGFVFTDKDGPEIYRLNQDEPARLKENPEELMKKIQEKR